MTTQTEIPAGVTKLDLQKWLVIQQKLLIALKDENPQQQEEVARAEECIKQIQRWLGR